MDKYRASIAKKMLDASGISSIYIDNAPENFQVPSMYFPPQEIAPSPSTLNAYDDHATLYAYVFDVTGNKALERANDIADSVASDRFLISVMSQDGKDSGEKFKVRISSTRKVDELSALITVLYDVDKRYAEDTDIDFAKYIYAEFEIKTKEGG